MDCSNAASFYQAYIGPALMGIGLAGLAWSRIGIPFFVLTFASYLGVVTPLGLPELAEPPAVVCSLAFAAGEIYLYRRLKSSRISRLLNSDMFTEGRAMPCLALFFFCTSNDIVLPSCGWTAFAGVVTAALISFGLAAAVYKTAKRFNDLTRWDINFIVLAGSLISVLAAAVPWLFFSVISVIIARMIYSLIKSP